ncbi:hypothetical protein SUGI_0323030 [Cryptomeria japonica]|nr:hypothetical protein SUGI_0323030 [Cryptomeria japonica]
MTLDWVPFPQNGGVFAKQRPTSKPAISARFYYKGFRSPLPAGEFLSPRDASGHGTHTSSTAAGSIVRNASLMGLAQGDVRGGLPGARIAVYKGHAINTFTMEQPWYPLVYGGDAANVSGGFSSQDSSGCGFYSLDRSLVQGKIVLCNLKDGSNQPDGGVYVSGGAGAIIMYDYFNDTAFSFMVPTTVISTEQGEAIRSYINSTRSPVASIAKSVARNNLPAPIVASFSSRGPSRITLDLLKPDISAPGVDILAAWSKAAIVSQNPLDKRAVDFNIVSGTSMACPHATGAAAYVKSFHPDWSPAAIKSALMTTAFTSNATLVGNQDGELGYGAGQINPLKAINPGLVYDADVNSYINMLCSQGYDKTSLRLLTGEFISCPSNLSKNGVWDLNYPSIMVIGNASEPVFAQFPRIVTNVGPAKCTYEAKIDAPFGMNVTVEPDTLYFTSSSQKVSYNLKIKSEVVPGDYTLLSGALTWSYGNYSVRSPILVYLL